MNIVLAALVFAALQTTGYPPHWWTPAPKEGGHEWEIPPQEAGRGENE